MIKLLCLSTLFLFQLPSGQTSPGQNLQGQNPPLQNQNNNAQNPNGLNPTGQNITGQNQSTINSPGQFGSMFQVSVDGTYQILTYEKFGQPLPGMNGIKVVIRNNILIFPGDGKFPGKMIQLAFGPNNTIMLTPLDSTKPNPFQTSGGTTPPIANSTVNQGTNTLPTNPSNGGNGNIAQSGFTQPNSNSERGVYVQSTEYLSISVNNYMNQNNGLPPSTNSGIPPIANSGNGSIPSNLNGGSVPPGVGATQTKPSGFRDPSLPLPGSGQPPSTTPQLPTNGTSAGGNQAVLFLKRVAN